MGLFKQAAVVFDGAGKRAFLVAKQHVFNHVLRHGGAVKADKRAVGAGRGLVQHARKHFLARTGGAFNQYRHVGQGHTVGQGQQVAADGVHIDHAAYLLLGGRGGVVGCAVVGGGVHDRAGCGVDGDGFGGLAGGAGAADGLGPGGGAPVIGRQGVAGTLVNRRNRGFQVTAFGTANQGNAEATGFDQGGAVF